MKPIEPPELSVVVPSVNGWQDIEGALAALECSRDCRIEILVPDRLGEILRTRVSQRFPEVVLLPMGPDVTIPEMRAAAFDRARAAAVAVIEDHVLVPPEWGRTMLAALESSDGVVGGAVENAATLTLMDRAAFLCEYSHCLPPIKAGSVDWLTGNNVVYRRDLLDRHQDSWRSGDWENRLHDALKAADVVLTCRPEIVVSHKKHYRFSEYMSQRFLYARSYAGARMRGAGLLKRLLYGVAALVLPGLLFLRIFGRVWAKGRDRGVLLRSVPLLVLFVCSWGLGEVVGAWFGAGDSLSRVC